MIKCDGITKKYFSKIAVNNLSLNLEQGKVYALLGPNGSGKSTLMKMLGGLVKCDSGCIYFDNEPLNFRHKAEIAYMPTEGFFFKYMTIENAGKYYRDFFRDFDFSKYLKIISMMNLDKKQKISSLSSGMMAKAKIALTLSRASRLIMLDEPLNGIDIIARDEIINIILSNISERSTILISSHLVDELEKIVDSAVYMKDGSIVTGGDAEDIRTRYGKSLVDIYRDIYGTGGYTNA